MVNILILKYNNYNNRIMRQEASLEAYKEAAPHYEVLNINFDKADGVSTKHVINFPVSWNEPFEGDYAIIYDPEDNSIISRWFIIENLWNNRNQIILTLRRDLIVDYYETYRNQPMFVEKAMLAASDPFIFNRENMTFNRIKTGERLLKDKTNSAWIVGYYPVDTQTTECPLLSLPTADAEYDSLSEYPYSIINGSTFNFLGYNSHHVISNLYTPDLDGMSSGHTNITEIAFNGEGVQSPQKVIYKNYQTITSICPGAAQTVIFGNDARSGLTTYRGDASTLKNMLNSLVTSCRGVSSSLSEQVRELHSCITEEYLSTLRKENGKILRFGNDYYRVNVVTTFTDRLKGTLVRVTDFSEGSYGATMKAFVKEANDQYGAYLGSVNANSIYNYAVLNQVRFSIDPIGVESIESSNKITIPQTAKGLSDAPYKMFAIPYKEGGFNSTFPGLSEPILTTTPETAMSAALGIAAKLSSAMTDLQLVPYLPQMEGVIMGDNFMRLSNTILTEHIDYEFITTASGTHMGIVLFPPVSKFSFIIDSNNEEKVFEDLSPIEVKIKNETEVYRLCSPNYQGQFEFNAMQNNGITNYNVDCWYKPGLPYIHIAPQFNGLYGTDFDDARGLICGGDFSLPYISNAWNEYLLQNKNYQNMFDRQIESLEVSRDIQRQEQNIQAAVGIGSAAISGAAGGAMVGGVYGAVGGAIAGTATSALGAYYDYQFAEQRHDEAVDFSKDMFGYQMGNIKAIPYSLTKVGAYTNNNKIWPFVEYYTSTDQEKQALRNKIKYNGMSVGRIETFDYFLPAGGYIKGQLIRTDGIDDAHVSSELIHELYKGVYTTE